MQDINLEESSIKHPVAKHPEESQIFAYTYSDPLLEALPDITLWDWPIEKAYQDQGNRQQWQQFLQERHSAEGSSASPTAQIYLVVRRLEELGDSAAAISTSLAELESLNIHLIPFNQLHQLHQPVSDAARTVIQAADLLALLQTVQPYYRSQELQRGHARNRIQALPPPGKAPYGYRRGKDRYILDRSTAPVVKDFFEHFLLYGSLRGSVRHLQKKYGKKISVSTGKRWLTSPVYRGDLTYHTGEVIPDTHTAILSREEAAQVDRLLRRNQKMPSRTASAPRSLSGLVSCGSCGSSMKISQVKTHHQDYLYLCPVACPRQPKCRALSYQQVLEQTIQQVCQDLPPAVNAAPLPNLDGVKQVLNAQVLAKQSVLEQLPGLIDAGVLDQETADLRAYKVRTELAALQAQVAQLPPVNLKAIAQFASLPQFWLDLSETERRFYFREFIRQIQILRQDSDWRIQLTFVF